MIRFVLSPQGDVVADLAEKLPGRGAWVTVDRDAVAAASEKGLFARAFKKPVTIAPAIGDKVRDGLVRRGLAAIGLARRTGDVVVGFDQVRAALKERGVSVLITANDGGEDGVEKLRRLAKKVGTPVVRAFPGADLAKALGRDHLVHVAIRPGAAASRFIGEASRLAKFDGVWVDAETNEPPSEGEENETEQQE